MFAKPAESGEPWAAAFLRAKLPMEVTFTPKDVRGLARDIPNQSSKLEMRINWPYRVEPTTKFYAKIPDGVRIRENELTEATFPDEEWACTFSCINYGSTNSGVGPLIRCGTDDGCLLGGVGSRVIVFDIALESAPGWPVLASTGPVGKFLLGGGPSQIEILSELDGIAANGEQNVRLSRSIGRWMSQLITSFSIDSAAPGEMSMLRVQGIFPHDAPTNIRVGDSFYIDNLWDSTSHSGTVITGYWYANDTTQGTIEMLCSAERFEVTTEASSEDLSFKLLRTGLGCEITGFTGTTEILPRWTFGFSIFHKYPDYAYVTQYFSFNEWGFSYPTFYVDQINTNGPCPQCEVGLYGIYFPPTAPAVPWMVAEVNSLANPLNQLNPFIALPVGYSSMCFFTSSGGICTRVRHLFCVIYLCARVHGSACASLELWDSRQSLCRK